MTVGHDHAYEANIPFISPRRHVGPGTIIVDWYMDDDLKPRDFIMK